MLKHTCCRCSMKAVWFYLPWSEGKIRRDHYFCEACVRRGCSCNLITDPGEGDIGMQTGEQYKDDQGRLLPCIEYDFNSSGYWNEETVIGKVMSWLSGLSWDVRNGIAVWWSGEW